MSGQLSYLIVVKGFEYAFCENPLVLLKGDYFQIHKNLEIEKLKEVRAAFLLLQTVSIDPT
jgi:hypothetical protein